MVSEKTVEKLLNYWTGLHECRACGMRWMANLKGEGGYPKGKKCLIVKD